MAGIKSYNDSARLFEYQDPNGRQFRSKNEYFIGGKTGQGWATYAQFVENVLSFGNAQKNKFSPSDPSFNIVHPVMDNGKLKITGQLREYFPSTDGSVKNQSWQQAYTSSLIYKMPHRYDLGNSLTFRYNSQPNYAAKDFQLYIEDTTAIVRPVAKWCRIGFGQHFQYETHVGVPTGKTLDVFPMADFMLSSTVFAGPRLYFPVAAQNTVGVNEAPSGVSLQNAQAEFYFQASL